MAGLSVAPNATPSTVPSKRAGKKPSIAPSTAPNQIVRNADAGTIKITFKPNKEFKPEDAATYNPCGFDLEKAVSITLEKPEIKEDKKHKITNQDRSYILTIEQPPETQDSGGIVDKITEYCAFDGKTETIIGGQIDSHTAYGTTNITYWTCDQKDSVCDITDRDRYATGDTNLKPKFENGKLIRRAQTEIQDKTPDKTGDEPK